MRKTLLLLKFNFYKYETLQPTRYTSIAAKRIIFLRLTCFIYIRCLKGLKVSFTSVKKNQNSQLVFPSGLSVFPTSGLPDFQFLQKSNSPHGLPDYYSNSRLPTKDSRLNYSPLPSPYSAPLPPHYSSCLLLLLSMSYQNVL